MMDPMQDRKRIFIAAIAVIGVILLFLLLNLLVSSIGSQAFIPRMKDCSKYAPDQNFYADACNLSDAVLSEDFSYCDQIVNGDRKTECYWALFRQDRNGSSTKADCQKFDELLRQYPGNISRTGDCMTLLAQRETDPVFCDGLADSRLRDCVMIVGVNINDSSVCDRLPTADRFDCQEYISKTVR